MYLLYGIGKIGKNYIEKCIEQGVTNIALTDSNECVWGKEYKGYPIQNPKDINFGEYDLVIITTNLNNYVQIKNEIETKSFNVNIIHYVNTLFISEDENYDLGNIVMKNVSLKSGIYTNQQFLDCLDRNSFNDIEKFVFEGKHNRINKWMHYLEAYDQFFSKYRGKDLKILEIGIFGGGSLQLWKDYFSKSNVKIKVYGIDIEPKCKCLETEDISIFIGSQEDRDFLQEVKKEIGDIDIIIDDGGHTMNQQIVTFEEMFEVLAEGGTYLCEDTHTSYWEEYGGKYKGDTFIEYAKDLIDKMHAQYSETTELHKNEYSEKIKSISFYDSMVFIEKCSKKTKTIDMVI